VNKKVFIFLDQLINNTFFRVPKGKMKYCTPKLGTVFLIAGVPSRSKMYRTSAIPDIHAVLHFATKSRVYAVHFTE
jgi:hypothetical protein